MVYFWKVCKLFDCIFLVIYGFEYIDKFYKGIVLVCCVFFCLGGIMICVDRFIGNCYVKIIDIDRYKVMCCSVKI